MGSFEKFRHGPRNLGHTQVHSWTHDQEKPEKVLLSPSLLLTNSALL